MAAALGARALRAGRLSVFRGGFEKDVAREVAAADLRALSTFVSKQLVIYRKDRPRHQYAWADGLAEDEVVDLCGGLAHLGFDQVTINMPETDQVEPVTDMASIVDQVGRI